MCKVQRKPEENERTVSLSTTRLPGTMAGATLSGKAGRTGVGRTSMSTSALVRCHSPRVCFRAFHPPNRAVPLALGWLGGRMILALG